MIRVKPRLRLEPMVELSLLLGAGVGLVFSLIFLDPLVQTGFAFWGRLLRISLIGILGPLLMFAVILSCLCQRRAIVVASGYAFCFGAVFVASFRVVAATAGDPLVVLIAVIPLGILSLFLAIIGGALAPLVCSMIKALFVEVLEQDGTLCPNCGYELMPLNIPRCPECGKNPQQSPAVRGAISHLSRLLYRQSRHITIIVLIVLAGMTVYHSLTAVGPMMRFSNRFDINRYGRTSADMYGEDFYQDDVTWRATGFTQILADDPTRAILVLYAPGAGWSQPIMQIRLQWAQKPKAGFPTTTFDGLPAVMTNLNKEQAEFVIEHGSVPQTLIDALLEAATEVGWLATPPTPGPFGQINQSYNWNRPARPVIVIADSYLRAEIPEENAASDD